MELCEYGDLWGVIETWFKNMDYLSSKEFLSYAYQICWAVYEIHKLDIMHRDLKPENFFMSKDNIIKLGDFGEAKTIEQASKT